MKAPVIRVPGFGELMMILVLCAVVFGSSKVNAIGDFFGNLGRRS